MATSGSLDWGVRKSFRDYLKSPIAHGTTVLGGGAIENADGTYRFPAAAVDPSAQTVAFGGSVSFSGHDDALAISIADIRLDLARGILIADVQSKSMGEDGVVTYADVDLTTLGSGEPLAGATISGGEAAGTALPTTLTESGAPAFASMYGAGSAFDPVTFTASYDVPVAIPVVAAPPVAQTVEVGQAVTFSADGTGYESVRWEASYNGSDWAPIDGASGATLTFTPLIADNGKQYRAVFINAGGEAPSDAALLTVTEPVVAAKPEVAASPAAASVKDGEDATFAAAGTGYESVQWQVSADGSEWADIAGAIAPTLTFTATVGGSGRQYRAAFTNGAGTVFSDAAVLTVAVAETVDPGPVEPEVPVFVPEVEVFAADGVTSLVGPVSEGTQIVVKGSGFDPAANVAPEGNRPPIAGGSPAGTYVVFGKFADVWQPSVSAPASARVVGDQKWALSQAAFDAVPAAFQGAVRGQWVEVSADGSFSTVLTVQKKVVSGAEVEWPEAGNFGVYTYAAGGTVNAAQELYAPVTVGGPGPVEPEVPVFVPEVEVFAADGVTSLVGPVSEGTQIVVKGSGFDPAANVAPEGNRPPIAGGSPAGTYVVFGKFADVWQPSVSAPASARVVGDQKWALSQAAFDAVPAAFQGAVRGQWVEVSADGSFSTVLTVQKKVVSGAEVEWPEAGNFGVYTYAAGGTVNAAQELYAPVTVGGPGPVEPEVPVFVPEVEVFAADGVTSLVGPVSEGTQIVVKGSGFDPAANVAPEGNRPPIAGGSPAGTYVVFGKFADVWQPSVSAPASARVVGDQKWALSQAAFDAVPAAFQGAVRGQWVEVSADGSFSTVLTVQKKVVSGAEVEWPEAGNFGVYTYAAGGTVNAAQELYAPVTVGGPGPVEPEVPVFVPEVEVFAADGVTSLVGPVSEGTQIVVKGSGFDPAANVAPEGNRPPIAGGSPAGTYVVFGKFADVWQPSVSAPASARVVGDQKWALSQAAFDAVPAAFQGAVRGQWVEVSADGSFSTVLTVQKKVVSGAEVEWPEAGNFGVYTYAAGGTVNAAQELYAPVTVGGPGPVEPEVPADKPTLTVEPATGLKHGSRVTVSGSGYGPSRWIYLAEVAQGPGGSDRPQDYENAARVKTNKDGTFGPIDFSVTTVFKNGGFNAVDGTLYIATFVSPLESDNEDAADRSQDAFVELAWADPSAPVVTEPEIPEFTLPKLFSMNTTVAAGGTLYLSGSDFAPGSQLAFDLDGNAIEVGTPASTEISGGLDWGVRASFRGYLEGNIAKGTITASEGATINGDGTFHFPAASYDADGKVAGYAGTLSMVGHEGALQVNLSNLRVDAKNKQLIADVVSKSLTGASENFTDVALVAIGATSLDGDGNGLSGKNLSTVLTEAGAPAFASFYEAGESFDALSFDIHEETVLNSLLVGEDGSFSGQWPVPATQKAGSYTLTATATAPQQARALVTAGVQTASMMLEVTAAAVNPGDGKDDEVAPELPPATVGPSKPVEKPVDTLPPVSNVPADAKCTNGTIVDGALVWGVKESFRKYITGNIADGNITFNGAEVSADQVFTFSNGIGTIDSTKRTGEVRFDGVASFQGHDYGSGAVLSVTISNVTLVLDGNAGSLKADVVSRSLESATEGAAPGGDVNYASVVLAELDLSSASLAGGGVAYAGTNIPAVLASSGVAPFADFYAAGDAMDPLSFILGCSGAAAIDVVNGGATGAPTDAPTASATAQPVPGTTATTAPTTVAAASAGTLAKTGATGMDAAVIGAIMILLLGAGVIAGNRATGRRRHS
ncbi:hypothetical protein JOF48_001383 [Arthrobacter stackebrandtii]|uniref:Immunoglobulin domain-containing protein n=1 Tax=Arthrobacter stackebrandtii TaxID=272161 RepID=A0ABS4YUV8_9MICC|nr:hypothetical protein [Arthrobacter stackebrandtii]